jgi:hypothetical protein
MRKTKLIIQMVSAGIFISGVKSLKALAVGTVVALKSAVRKIKKGKLALVCWAGNEAKALLPFIEFLHQDPDTPPPFFLVGFACYWTILALILHYLLSKIKPSR